MSLDLPADPAAARISREFVCAQLGCLNGDLIGNVQLVVTELVSNAVRYGEPAYRLTLWIATGSVTVGVLDHGHRTPSSIVEPVAASASSGRGLMIVNELAESWGVDQPEVGAGKTVWARFAVEEATGSGQGR